MFRTFLMLLVVSAISITAVGQAVTGSIVGNVADASGGAIAGAKVTITEVNTGIAHTASVNEEGGYVLSYLPPGIYRVEVEKDGFKRFVRDNVTLSTGSTVRINIALEVGNITETAEVTGGAPLLQTESADVNQSFQQKLISELPINGRNFQSLIALVPGAAPPTSTIGTFDNPQGTQFFQVNGQNNSANNFQIDGVDNNEPLLGLVVQIPPAEAIQQFSVSTSNYDAEFGRAVGAVINVTTRPGTNEFHGSAFEFLNSSAFKARNFFNLTRNANGNIGVPNAIKNQFGGTFGGPIIKNRTFFFGDYQGQTQRIGRTPAIVTVPTAAFRNGDFSALLPGTVIYDPATGNPDGSGRLPISCNGRANVICPERLSSVAKNILQFLPLPEPPGPECQLSCADDSIPARHAFVRCARRSPVHRAHHLLRQVQLLPIAHVRPGNLRRRCGSRGQWRRQQLSRGGSWTESGGHPQPDARLQYYSDNRSSLWFHSLLHQRHRTWRRSRSVKGGRVSPDRTRMIRLTKAWRSSRSTDIPISACRPICRQ